MPAVRRLAKLIQHPLQIGGFSTGWEVVRRWPTQSDIAGRKGDGWIYHEMPLGLQIVNVATLTGEQQLDLPVTEMALSPDGKWLLLKSAYDEAGPDGKIEWLKNGLYLVDSASMAVTAHLLPDSDVYLQGFSPGGGYACLSTAASEWQGDHYGNWRVMLHAVDLQSGQLVAERNFLSASIK